MGYATKPPVDPGFLRHSIHFPAACKQGVKNCLAVDLRKLLASALPDNSGIVQISTETGGRHAQSQLAFEDRYFDVPAAAYSTLELKKIFMELIWARMKYMKTTYFSCLIDNIIQVEQVLCQPEQPSTSALIGSSFGTLYHVLRRVTRPNR